MIFIKAKDVEDARLQVRYKKGELDEESYGKGYADARRKFEMSPDMYDQGVEDGYANGCMVGACDAKKSGNIFNEKAKSFRAGQEAGKVVGYNEGRRAGDAEGRDKGYDIGHQEGYILGRQDAITYKLSSCAKIVSRSSDEITIRIPAEYRDRNVFLYFEKE